MSGPPLDRRKRIEDCQGLVRSLALQIKRKAPAGIGLDDLIAYGQVGLAEAARDFDPQRGFQFATFAYYRVRGAIYDGISKMSWFNGRHHRQEQDASKDEELRTPDVTSAEGETAPPGRKSERKSDDRKRLTMTALPSVAYIPDGAAKSPPAEATERETFRQLHELVNCLPPQEGDIIRATYFEGTTLQEAGARLGISKSWATRLHARALERLAFSLRPERKST